MLFQTGNTFVHIQYIWNANPDILTKECRIIKLSDFIKNMFHLCSEDEQMSYRFGMT